MEMLSVMGILIVLGMIGNWVIIIRWRVEEISRLMELMIKREIDK